jgi:hypothetical protein
MAGIRASSHKGDYFEGDSPYYCVKFTTVGITSDIQILLEWLKYYYTVTLQYSSTILKPRVRTLKLIN